MDSILLENNDHLLMEDLFFILLETQFDPNPPTTVFFGAENMQDFVMLLSYP